MSLKACSVTFNDTVNGKGYSSVGPQQPPGGSQVRGMSSGMQSQMALMKSTSTQVLPLSSLQ